MAKTRKDSWKDLGGRAQTHTPPLEDLAGSAQTGNNSWKDLGGRAWTQTHTHTHTPEDLAGRAQTQKDSWKDLGGPGPPYPGGPGREGLDWEGLLEEPPQRTWEGGSRPSPTTWEGGPGLLASGRFPLKKGVLLVKL